MSTLYIYEHVAHLPKSSWINKHTARLVHWQLGPEDNDKRLTGVPRTLLTRHPSAGFFVPDAIVATHPVISYLAPPHLVCYAL